MLGLTAPVSILNLLTKQKGFEPEEETNKKPTSPNAKKIFLSCKGKCGVSQKITFADLQSFLIFQDTQKEMLKVDRHAALSEIPLSICTATKSKSNVWVESRYPNTKEIEGPRLRTTFYVMTKETQEGGRELQIKIGCNKFSCKCKVDIETEYQQSPCDDKTAYGYPCTTPHVEKALAKIASPSIQESNDGLIKGIAQAGFLDMKFASVPIINNEVNIIRPFAPMSVRNKRQKLNSS